jgi:hypothetical protein
MSEFISSEAGELPRDVTSIEYLACMAIDQVVVDGVVDGLKQRAPHKMLVKIAFPNSPPAIMYDFDQALVQDPRFIDVTRRRYSYRPELSAGSTVQATMRAIVAGRARCSAERREEVMLQMEEFTAILYGDNRVHSGILDLSYIGRALKRAGKKLSNDEFGGLLQWMHQDPRFYPLENGRIVLTELFRGSLDELLGATPLPASTSRVSSPHSSNRLDTKISNALGSTAPRPPRRRGGYRRIVEK